MAASEPTLPRGLAEYAPHLPPALERIGVACYILDRDGCIVWINGAGRDVMGDLVGRPLASVVGARDAPGAYSRFRRRLAGEETGDFKLDVVDARGNEVRVEVSSAPLGPSHRAVGMFGIVTPIGRGGSAQRADERLTARQLDVLRQLGDGASTDQIAGRLCISRETARNHVRHVLQRLGARSRLEAVAIGHRDGLL